jgi:hypothetical protein
MNQKPKQNSEQLCEFHQLALNAFIEMLRLKNYSENTIRCHAMAWCGDLQDLFYFSQLKNKKMKIKKCLQSRWRIKGCF